MNSITCEEIEKVINATLAWSERENWKGWNKHDGLNSPILARTMGWGKVTRLIAIQGVMRFPVNVRPLLLAPKTYNPKGLALFIQAFINRYRYSNNEEDLTKAENLADLVISLSSRGQWSGSCWGYHYPWQDPGFYAPANTPNAVVSSFVCEALLDLFEVTGNDRYLEIVASAINFFKNDLTILKDTGEELCLGYMPMPMSMRVMDVSILIGSVLARFDKLSNQSTNSSDAKRLVTYVVNRQTDYGAWFYTDPPHDSHITHDNYHTGFILDALDRYMKASGDLNAQESYAKGLLFYKDNLFNEDGSPRWMHDKDYPHDIHGAAQGILTFSRHGDEFPDMAEKIASWTVNIMYNREGRFYYRENRYYKNKYTLLRWCNAWMLRGLSAFVTESRV